MVETQELWGFFYKTQFDTLKSLYRNRVYTKHKYAEDAMNIFMENVKKSPLNSAIFTYAIELVSIVK